MPNKKVLIKTPSEQERSGKPETTSPMKTYPDSIISNHSPRTSFDQGKNGKIVFSPRSSSRSSMSPSSPGSKSTKSLNSNGAGVGVGGLPDWTPLDNKVNLPALLNDPSKWNSSGYRDTYFTRTWGQDFVPPGDVDPPHNIPYPITWRFFDNYLTEKTRSKLARHQRIKKRMQAEKKAKLNESGGPNEISSSLSPEPTSPSAFQCVDISDTISSIPQYFLSNQFSLNNIDALTKVILSSENGKTSEKQLEKDLQKSTENSTEIQPQTHNYTTAREQLNGHLDNIENAIAKLLKDKAGGLFESISKTEKMQATMQDASKSFAALREKNQKSRKNIIVNVEKIRQNNEKKKKLQFLLETLKTVSVVYHTDNVMKTLDNDGDYVASLDLINETEGTLESLENMARNGVDIKRKPLSCLQNYQKSFQQQKQKIEQDMYCELEKLVSDFLTGKDHSIHNISAEDRIKTLISNILPSNDKLSDFCDFFRKEIASRIKNIFEDSDLENNYRVQFETWWTRFHESIEKLDAVNLKVQVLLGYATTALGFSSLEQALNFVTENTSSSTSQNSNTKIETETKKIENEEKSTPTQKNPVAHQLQEVDMIGLTLDENEPDDSEIINQKDLEKDLAQLLGNSPSNQITNDINNQTSLKNSSTNIASENSKNSSNSTTNTKTNNNKIPADQKIDNNAEIQNKKRIISQLSEINRYLSVCSQDYLQAVLRQISDNKLVEDVAQLSLILAILSFSLSSNTSPHHLQRSSFKNISTTSNLDTRFLTGPNTSGVSFQSLGTGVGVDPSFVLGNFHLLDDFSEGSTVSGTVFTADSDFLDKKSYFQTKVKSVIDEVTKSLVSHWHDAGKRKIEQVLDYDTWVRDPKDLIPDHFIDAVKVLSGEIKIENYSPSSPAADNRSKNPSALPASEALTICGENFAAVSNSCLFLLHTLLEIVQNVRTLPNLCIGTGAMVASQASTGLLDYYNRRSCKLIIGAEATKTGAIKTVTARHMAILKRSLELIIITAPSVLALLAPELPKFGIANIRRNMQTIEGDFESHINLLKTKLTSLLEPFFEKYIYNYSPQAGSSNFKKFCRQIERFHDAIYAILPPEQLVELLMDVHGKFKKFMRKALMTHQIVQDGSPNYVIVAQDLQFYVGNFSKLKALEMEAVIIDDIWSNESVNLAPDLI